MKKMTNNPLFNVFDDVFFTSNFNYTPDVKIKKVENAYRLLMSVPGLTKDDLKISVKEGELEISYEKVKNDDSIWVGF